MTATNHAVTGALVAVLVDQPLLAIPLAFVIHFFMDAVPHFGLNISDTDKQRGNKTFMLVLVGDIFISLILLISLPIILSPFYDWWLVFACMFVCMSPDLVWGWHFYYAIKTKQKRLKKWFSIFHTKIQWSETIAGGLVEIAWFIIILNLINNLAYS